MTLQLKADHPQTVHKNTLLTPLTLTLTRWPWYTNVLWT